MRNPHRRVRGLERRRRGGGLRWLLPVAAAVAAVPLARPVLLGFLDVGVLARGVEAISFRIGALVAGAMSLHTYADLVRSPHRPILDAHPVRPRDVLTATLEQTARERSYLPLVGIVLLSPLALDGHWRAWLGAAGVVVGAWVAMLGVGFAVHLGGVWAGLSPRLAHTLDVIRGSNPRMQAALIYAPGVALLLVGGAVSLGASGVSAALAGWAPGWAFLSISPLAGVVGWLAARPLSDRYLARATALLTEIDGIYAGVDDAQESRHVYLEWAARGDPELLRALRQGWRRLRPWAVGGWLLGLVGGLAGWASGPDAPAQVLAVCGGSVLLIAALPARLAEGDPPWLDRAVGVRPWKVASARARAALLYAQAAVLPAAGALLIRHGLDALVAVVQVEAMAVGAAVVAAAAATRWRGRSIWAYGPLAIVAWAAVVGMSW